MSLLIQATSKETLATLVIEQFLTEKNDTPDGNQIVFNSTLSVVLENPGMRQSVEKLLVRANFSRANIHRIISNESILDVYIVDDQDEYQDTSILDDMFYQLFQKSNLLLKLVSMAEDISLDRNYSNKANYRTNLLDNKEQFRSKDMTKESTAMITLQQIELGATFLVTKPSSENNATQGRKHWKDHHDCYDGQFFTLNEEDMSTFAFLESEYTSGVDAFDQWLKEGESSQEEWDQAMIGLQEDRENLHFSDFSTSFNFSWLTLCDNNNVAEIKRQLSRIKPLVNNGIAVDSPIDKKAINALLDKIGVLLDK